MSRECPGLLELKACCTSLLVASCLSTVDTIVFTRVYGRPLLQENVWMQDLLSDHVFFGQAVQTLVTGEMRPDFLVVARKFCH